MDLFVIELVASERSCQRTVKMLSNSWIVTRKGTVTS
jgi:hypothetical protein